MKKALKDFFTLSSRERTGMMVLLILVIVAMAANFRLRYFPCQPDAYDYSAFNRELEEFRNSLSRVETKPETVRKETRRSGDRSVFPAADREKDKEKAWSLNHNSLTGRENARGLPAYNTFRYEERVEINAADSATLKKLRGIGPVLASRIVKYRSLLGGYHSVDQLTEVYGISDSLFEAVSKHVYIDSTLVRKISVNEASENRLSMHPYIGKYGAQAIIAYRNHAGIISGMDELVENRIIPEKSRNKVESYLDFGKGEEAGGSGRRQGGEGNR